MFYIVEQIPLELVSYIFELQDAGPCLCYFAVGCNEERVVQVVEIWL